MSRPILAALITMLTLASSAYAEPVEFRDDLGRTIKLEAPAARIAALSHYAVDPLIEMGTAPIARGDVKFELSEAAREVHAISVRHSAGPNLEQLAALDTDLIIVSIVHAGFVETIEKAVGTPVAVLDPTSFDDLLKEIRLLGTITGNADKADAIASRLDEEVTEIVSGTTTSTTRVYALFGAPGAFFAFMPETYLGDAISLVGGELVNAGEESKLFRGFSPFSVESALASDPDVIVLISHMAADQQLEMLANFPGWNALRAVKEDRVVVLQEHHFVSAPGYHPAE
ncbi:MAG: ABC transporter substrate-binding protein, partial [Phycisphaerales bacterium JB058]